jgi:ATP/maltotriose-dependent transcriptional regulator MalT
VAEVDRGQRRANALDEPDTLAPFDAGAALVERAPTAPHFAVSRPRLVQQMDDATTRRLTMVVGPAGSGKSVLLAQWAAATAEPSVAWLSITDGDQHGPSLIGRLRSTLAQLAPGAPAAARPSDTAASLREVAATRAGILVVEDLDRLLSVALTREIGDLIEAAPDALRFVVTSRVDPVLPLHRLRLLDEVTEIRQADLAFDVAEARPLLSSLARQPLSPEQAEVLVARTEGWAAGLQLAALSLRTREDISEFVAEFSGNDRHVADYFGNEVLDQLPDDVRRFLLQTSVLDTVTPAICAALTEEDEASTGARLASLSRQGLFVTPLHESHGIYRYHRLFRDLLRLRLRIEQPGRERQLLCTAGEWHRERGELDDAADCFIAAGAWEDLIGMLMGFGRTGMVELRQASILRWFAALPESERWANPDIALFHALAFVHAGNALAAEQLLAEIADRFDLTQGQEAVRLVHLAFLCQWHLPPDRAVAAAQAALDTLESCTQDDLPAIAGLTGLADLEFAVEGTIGRALLQMGDIDGARQHLTPRLAEGSGVHLLFLIHGFGIAATAEAWAGNLGAAERLARQAFDVAEAGRLTPDPSSADAFLALSVVARERNDLARAADLLDEAHARARQNRRHALLWAVHAERAQLSLSLGRPAQGLRILRDARGEGHPPAPPGIAARLRAVSAKLLLASLDPTPLSEPSGHLTTRST